MSGYIVCHCPNCMEIAISDDDETISVMCWECEDAGCDGKSSCSVIPEEESEDET